MSNNRAPRSPARRAWKIRLLTSILLAGICLALAFPARAQFIGYTSPQTVQQTLASNVACTGAQQNFNAQNLGQTQHRAIIVWSAQPQSSIVQILGLDAAGNSAVISDAINGATVPSTATVVSAEGNYPIIRIQVTCSNAGSPTFTLTYEGSSSSALSVAGTALWAQQNKVIFAGVTAGAGAASNIAIAPFGSSAGQVLFQYVGGAGPAGSTLVVKCGSTLDPVNTANFISYTFVLSTATPVQVFNIPAGPCMQYTVNYNSGGASAVTVNTEYLFLPPTFWPSAGISSLTSNGFNDGPLLTEKGARWSVTSTPAAGSQATASRGAGNIGTRKVADCVNYSAGAVAAPAATALQINLRDGASGAGTVIWSITVIAPATAGQHVNGHVCGLNLIGSNQTAMTLEFSAALASESESVTLTGYDVQ